MSREFDKVIVDGIIIDAYEKQIKDLKKLNRELADDNHDLRQKVQYMDEWEDKALDLIGKLFNENAKLIKKVNDLKDVLEIEKAESWAKDWQ